MKTIRLTRSRLSEIIDSVRQTKVCMIGDLCLDVYWHADMTKSRLSRETPHFPLPVVRESMAPGGGGNVLQNIHALGVNELCCISAVGEDWRGHELIRVLEEQKISTENIIKTKGMTTPCYCKPHRYGISDVVYEDPRLDFENFSEISPALQRELRSRLKEQAGHCDIVVVCDQLRYGIITPLIREFLEIVSEEGRKVVVDSRENIGLYREVILKPNELEAAAALGRKLTGSHAGVDEMSVLAKELARNNQQPVVVTCGSAGAVWCDHSDAVASPAVDLKGKKLDTVGAGDTFLAAFAAAYGSGISGPEAVAFANIAAGVTVQKIGMTGTASAEEMQALL